jgi:hypothetical protein
MKSKLLVVAGVAAVAALGVLLAAGQHWGSATVTGADRQHLSVTGRQVSSALPALAGALVAFAVAIVAAHGLLRRVVAVLGTSVAATEVAVAVYAHDDVGNALAARTFGVAAGSVSTHANSWWILATAAGVVAAVAFGAVALAGGRWQGMGARYDAPRAAARQRDPDVAAWEALDRGDDPTA